VRQAFKWTRKAVLVILVASGVGAWSLKGCSTVEDMRYGHVVPPVSIQTFDDFLQWQTEIQYCLEVNLRGITYYHVIGPEARSFPSDGALYVFDANGNYVGWSRDAGDVMREEAVFYPYHWLPAEAFSMTEISLDELKARIQNKGGRVDSQPPKPATLNSIT
jgi:hypothetical protein